MAETTADAGGGLLEYEGFALAVPAGSLRTGKPPWPSTPRMTTPTCPPRPPAPCLRIEGHSRGRGAGLSPAPGSHLGQRRFAGRPGGTGILDPQPAANRHHLAGSRRHRLPGLGHLRPAPWRAPRPDKAGTTAPITVTVGARHRQHRFRGLIISSSTGFPATATNAQISRLMGFIDNAMAQYDFMGFQQEGFTDWPINVPGRVLRLVRPLGPRPAQAGRASGLQHPVHRRSCGAGTDGRPRTAALLPILLRSAQRIRAGHGGQPPALAGRGHRRLHRRLLRPQRGVLQLGSRRGANWPCWTDCWPPAPGAIWRTTGTACRPSSGTCTRLNPTVTISSWPPTRTSRPAPTPPPPCRPTPPWTSATAGWKSSRSWWRVISTPT